jgi:hypothetical protein
LIIKKPSLRKKFLALPKEILYFINKEKRYREMKAKEIVEG